MPCEKTGLKSQSRSTYLVPRLHRLLVIAESTDALLGFELEDLGAKDVIFRAGGSLGGGAAKLRRLPQRCFPPPSSVDEADPKLDRRCLIVRDANGQALAYVYFEGESRKTRGGQAAHSRRGPAHCRQHRQAPGVVDCPPEPNPARAVVCLSGRETTPPIPSPKFPVREAPLASVERGFLLPPIRNKALNGAAAEC